MHTRGVVAPVRMRKVLAILTALACRRVRAPWVAGFGSCIQIYSTYMGCLRFGLSGNFVAYYKSPVMLEVSLGVEV